MNSGTARASNLAARASNLSPPASLASGLKLAGARASNLSALHSNIRSRLPDSTSSNGDEVFHEGYVLRKQAAFGGLMGTTWVRVFCILQQHGQLLLNDTWASLSDDSPPQAMYQIDSHTKLTTTSSTSVTLSFHSKGDVHLAFDSPADCQQWTAVLSLELAQQRGGDAHPNYPYCLPRSRHFEGYLFKTPPSAARWEERWFELSSGGVLTYRLSPSTTGPAKGTIDLETCKVVLNKTDAAGVCTPYYFQIHAFDKVEGGGGPQQPQFARRVYNLAAPTQQDYLHWLKALKMWIGVKRPDPLTSSTMRLVAAAAAAALPDDVL